jgi:hypothetical protein
MYQPCQCSTPYDKCFRCAVTYVVRSIVGMESCDCEGASGGLCPICRLKRMPNFELAYAETDPKSWTDAEARAGSKGQVARDICDPDGRAIGSLSRQGPELAAVELVNDARQDPRDYLAALHFVANFVREGRVVPEPLREWAYSAITGKIQPPRLKGKVKGATRARDVLIMRLIDDIQEMGIPPTSGDHERGRSGCHAVSEALTYLNLPPRGYERIRSIWCSRNSRSLREVRIGSPPV